MAENHIDLPVYLDLSICYGTRGDPDNHNFKIMLLIISSWELGYVIYVTAVTGNKIEFPVDRHSTA